MSEKEDKNSNSKSAGDKPSCDKKDGEKKKSNKDVSNYLEMNPTINESKSDTIVVSFGRFNPITTGHEKLVNKVISIAQKSNANVGIYASHSYDRKKNPLPYNSKIRYLQKAFGKNIIKVSKARTIIEVAKELSGEYKNIVVVVGSDRVREFQRLLTTYNGRDYQFETIRVVSAGERDPDASDVTGMSASKLRALAAEGDFESFRRGLPKKLQSSATKIFDEVRDNMDIAMVAEDILDERSPLSMSQRRSRGRTMKRMKGRISRARKRSAKRKASPEKLKSRARRKARNLIKDRLSGNKKYANMSSAQKMQIDKRAQTIPSSRIDTLAKRQLPLVRKAEMERLRKRSKKESLNELFEQYILKESNSLLDQQEIELIEALNDMYEDAVQGYDFYEEIAEACDPHEEGTEEVVSSYVDDTPGQRKSLYPKKRYHHLYTKKGKVNCDRRFKMFWQKKNESYYDSEIENEYGDLPKGVRVIFSSHSMGNSDINDEEKEGVVVGSTLRHLRVRDDSGKLYKVRHNDVEITEQTEFFTLDESFELAFLNESSLLDRAVAAIHRHVSKGKDLDNVIWEFMLKTGANIPNKEIKQEYIKTYGNPYNKGPVDSKRKAFLRKKYLGTS